MKYFRGIQWILRVLAALPLAIGLIALDAGVLAWATFMESRYGMAAAHFGIYDTGWFLALNVALAVNVLCALLIRWPWKRRHAGFLLTHVGILVLLLGCLLSQLGGVEAHLPVFEGQASYRAYTDAQHFELQVTAKPTPSATGVASAPHDPPIRVPFIAGPFSWRNYASLAWFPWHLPQRSIGKLYDHDGIVLEVLDYVNQPEPRVRVRLTLDGKTDEFELTAMNTYDLVVSGSEPHENQRHQLPAAQRSATVTLRPDEVDLGFQVALQQFQQKLDPGSDMPSHYSSLVDFLDRGAPPQRLHAHALITLNVPVDVADPQTGRAWRLFQASFWGPWKPGDPTFDQHIAPPSVRDQLYASLLSVNYDPGRGAKYMGSLMIVAGLVVVYYLRVHPSRTNGIRPTG